MEQYKIFVLDDLKGNLDAAIKGLTPYSDGDILTATNYNEGKKILENVTPDIAFIDLNFPRDQGGIEEKLGYKFQEEILNPRYIPHVVITGGVTNHDKDSAEIIPRMILCYGEWGTDSEVFQEWHRVITRPGVTKSNPEAWQKAYDTLTKTIKGTNLYLESRKLYNEQVRNNR